MEATFFFGSILPPPAARAEILAGLDGAGARGAADADETSVMQGVIWNIVVAHEVAHMLESPVEKRVKFEKLMRRVPFEGSHVVAVGRLLRADAGDPKLLPFKRPAERLYFADMATFLSVFDGVVETVRAFFSQKCFDGGGLGVKNFDGLLVAFEGTRPGGVSFLKIASCVERENPDRQLVGKNQVRDDLVFDTKTGAEHGPAGELLGQKSQRFERTSVGTPLQLGLYF